MKRRLAIITTHPIQYNAPLFELMNKTATAFTIKVFYTWSQSKHPEFDKGFGRSVAWDIPLLKGYDYTFVNNISAKPGTHHFNGIKNPGLIKEIEEWKADAILVFGWSFLSHLKALRYFHKKIPVLFRGDSTLIDEPAGLSIKKIVRKIFLTWVYNHVDYALYVGVANKRYFLKHGLRSSQLLFAPHAIDNNRFSGNHISYSEKAKNWRLNWGIDEKDTVFLFAGKLTQKKDPEILIKAFIAISMLNTWLIIAGNGKLESVLKDNYSSYTSIIFIDFKNQSLMPIVYRLGDIFVLPSKGPGETWGLAVNEAMAAERAIITSDKCGCSEDLIIKNKNGYVFESENVESLAEAMRNALLNYNEMGQESKKIIDNWTYSKTIGQLESLFKNKLLNEES